MAIEPWLTRPIGQDHPTVGIVAVTVHEDADTRERILTAGVDASIKKGIESG